MSLNSNILNQKKNIFKSFDTINIKGSYFYWIKFLIIIIFANLILALLYNKIVLFNKIYIPSYYFLSQTFYNLAENQLSSKIQFGFNIPLVIFYVISFCLNIPLFIFSWFKLGKKYTTRSIISIIIWFLIGLILSINAIDSWLKNILEFNILNGENENKEKVKIVGYYLIAFFSGICIGLTGGIIWKQQTSGGGTDFIYTYLAIEKKKEIHKISIIINLIIITFSIVLNEIIIKRKIQSLDTFFLLLIAALMFSFSYTWTINYIYPKFKLVNLMIITTNFEKVREKIITKYKRGGNIINVKGLFDSKDKKIIITTITFLEQTKLINEIQKIDKNAFFISHSVLSIKGNFKIKAYDDN